MKPNQNKYEMVIFYIYLFQNSKQHPTYINTLSFLSFLSVLVKVVLQLFWNSSINVVQSIIKKYASIIVTSEKCKKDT